MDSYTIKIRYSLVVVLLLVMAFAWCECDDSKEREECGESVVGVAMCLPYVGGTAKSPTPDCCTALKQLLNTNKKCLCVIIKDRNDPDLGLNINLTLALGLPQACNAPANISQCPALLNLAPDSPDAQIFYQNSTNGSSSPADNVKPGPSSFTTTSSGEQENGGGNGERFIGLKIFGGLLFLWSVTSVFVI